MIQSILYATDLGLYASGVLQHALNLCQAHQAELHVLHVVEPLGLFARSVLRTYLDDELFCAVDRGALDSVMASIEHRVREGFADELGFSPQEVEHIRQVRVLQGDPPQVILQEAAILGVDLLVIGSHSNPAPMMTPMGRTASRLLQLSRIPVYMVPMRQR